MSENRFESVGIFQYHDEPLASSYHLRDKVPDLMAKERVEKVGKLLECIYAEQRESTRGRILAGYIMETGSKKKEYIIRREIQAPEIDEYDHVIEKNIITKGECGIGDFVEYR
jgi:ribosomal protein S12 methylthiotransferase